MFKKEITSKGLTGHVRGTFDNNAEVVVKCNRPYVARDPKTVLKIWSCQKKLDFPRIVSLDTINAVLTFQPESF